MKDKLLKNMAKNSLEMVEVQSTTTTLKFLMVNGRKICQLENVIFHSATYGVTKVIFTMECFMAKEYLLLMELV
jgi:hypothetical protein